MSGDVVLAAGSRRLPKNSSIAQPDRFFSIPEELLKQKDYLRAAEYPTETVVTMRNAEFQICCSFLKSRLDPGLPLRAALDELESHIARITAPDYRPDLQDTSAKRHGKHALHEAAVRGNISLIDEIVKLHPEQLEVEDGNGLTPLENAVWLGTAIAVKCLISHGANPNVVDGHGQTPLHVACIAGDLEKISLLVEHGADINASKSDGFRPIHHAVMSRRKDIVEYLRGKGAEFNPNDETIKEALTIARQWKNQL